MTPIFTVDDFVLFTVHPCCRWSCQALVAGFSALRAHISNELAPEARKKLAPAEGRGFRFVVRQPRRGVRLCESIIRRSVPQGENHWKLHHPTFLHFKFS